MAVVYTEIPVSVPGMEQPKLNPDPGNVTRDERLGRYSHPIYYLLQLQEIYFPISVIIFI